MKIAPQTPPLGAGAAVWAVSDAGGLCQFALRVFTLRPGGQAGPDDGPAPAEALLVVLQGCVTLLTAGAAHDLHRAEAACWPRGDLRADRVENRGAGPASFALVTLPGAAGAPTPGPAGPRLLRVADLPWQDEPDTPHPILGTGPGPYRACLISDRGGLTGFGAFFEELPPGSSSGRRHWHETEDEMILMLQGAAILVEDHEAPLAPGDAACWPAGHPTGHRIDNPGPAPARYLVIGTRLTRDTIHYTDHDLITLKDGAARRYLHRDGTPRLRP